MSTEIKKQRIRTGLTQEEAAKKIGVHPTTLNKYESGVRHPSGKVLANMAKLFQVPMDSLLGGGSSSIHTVSKEDETMLKARLTKVEGELLELFRENKLLRALNEELQKKEGTHKQAVNGD